MLRKIVKMIMGSSPEVEPELTYLEDLLDRIRPDLHKQFKEAPKQDPLEALAVAIMRAASKQQNINPQAARAFFSVLVENDQLPHSEQLTEGELDLLKNLLNEYFIGNDQVRSRANEVLALIEKKFSTGAFTQARILLQIFETDTETRLNNERNLFYEDMILRLGIRRRQHFNDQESKKVQSIFTGLKLSNETQVREAIETLAKDHYIEFCFSLQNPKRTAKWRHTTSTIHEEEDRERLLAYIPARRWARPSSQPDQSLIALSQQHLLNDALRKYIQALTKMCYFLLLASGDTGFQAYLYAYLTWCREQWGVDARRILPTIHRRSVLEECGLQDTLDNIYDEHFADIVTQRCDLGEASLIHKAWEGLIKRLSESDVNEIPPGHYDLGALLLDSLVSFKFPDPQFSFKIHRLT